MVTFSRIAIDQIEVSTYTVPTDFPSRMAPWSGIPRRWYWSRSHAGNEFGLGYTYADTATATLIHDLLSEVVEGQDAMAPASSWNAMVARTRNLGRPGVVSMAISAVDIALWDLKARLAQPSTYDAIGSGAGLSADLWQWRIYFIYG